MEEKAEKNEGKGEKWSEVKGLELFCSKVVH